jgi:hypothetical protein
MDSTQNLNEENNENDKRQEDAYRFKEMQLAILSKIKADAEILQKEIEDLQEQMESCEDEEEKEILQKKYNELVSKAANPDSDWFTSIILGL